MFRSYAHWVPDSVSDGGSPPPMSVRSPKLSLVITNYNRAAFLDRSIRSCVGQILFRVPFEIIVVDDASTDGSVELLSEFGPDLITVFNETNLGVAASSNRGLETATGEYFMRVDADDFLNQFASAFMMEVLDTNPEIDFVYCDHYRVDVRGVKISKVRLDNDDALFEHGAGVMFRSQLLRDIGGYDDTLSNCEDYDLLVRIKQGGYRGFYLPVPLYRYYIHGENLTLGPDREAARRAVRERHGLT